MADKKISQLPVGAINSDTKFPFVTDGVTSQNSFENIVTALEPYFSGGSSESLWSAGTGTDSVVQNNSKSYAIGDNSLVGGQGNTAYTQSSVSFGTKNIASGITEMAYVETDFSIFSATTTVVQPNVPGYESDMVGAFVFDGDVSEIWQHYLWDNDNIFYLSGGSEPILTLDTGNSWDAFYDSGTDKTYVVFEEITATTYTSVYGSGTYEEYKSVAYPSFAFGINGESYGKASFSEGFNTTARGNASHAEGEETQANGNFGSHAEGYGSIAGGEASHAEGSYTEASGRYSHAEGNNTTASGDMSHAEGLSTTASGQFSHAEGQTTTASGYYSHSEGSNTIASGSSSHAEGGNTQANGNNSHAEGYLTIAGGYTSHAEGQSTQALGDSSHAGGQYSVANGVVSFIHGSNSVANGNTTIVLGSNIIGNQDNTTYVDNLNIKTLSSGTSVTSLGLDVDGYVVSGSGGSQDLQSVGESGRFQYLSDETFSDPNLTYFSMNNSDIGTQGAIYIESYSETNISSILDVTPTGFSIESKTGDDIISLSGEIDLSGKILRFTLPNTKSTGIYTLATLDDIPTGGTQGLQSVLDNDNTSLITPIILDDGDGVITTLNGTEIRIDNASGGSEGYITTLGPAGLKLQAYNAGLTNGPKFDSLGIFDSPDSGDYGYEILFPPIQTEEYTTYTFPTKISGDYTIATTEDYTLQNVLDNGNTAISTIRLFNEPEEENSDFVSYRGDSINFFGNSDGGFPKLTLNGGSIATYSDPNDSNSLCSINIIDGSGSFVMPNKPQGVSYTLATLDDIPTGGTQDLQSVLNNGGIINNENSEITFIDPLDVDYSGNVTSIDRYGVTVQHVDEGGLYQYSIANQGDNISINTRLITGGTVNSLFIKTNPNSTVIDGYVLLPTMTGSGTEVTLATTSTQIEIGTSQPVSSLWDGNTIIFTTSCTITIPSTLPNEFIFNGITLEGVVITWEITAPHTWLFGTPTPTSEKQIFTLTKRGSTNSILLLGV